MRGFTTSAANSPTPFRCCDRGQRRDPNRPLSASRRRALVRTALGANVYRLSAERVAAITDDAARLGLDAHGTLKHAAAWGTACRRALDAGLPLPLELPLEPVAEAEFPAPGIPVAANDAPS